MVDIIGLHSGIRPFKGAKEMTFFDMDTGGMGFEPKNNNVREPASGMYTPLSKPPDQFNPILQTKSMNGVLHCKGQPEAIKYGRRDTSLTDNMYPQSGYARHQPLGLATDFNKPMNGPVMPIEGFYNPDAQNVLGNVPG